MHDGRREHLAVANLLRVRRKRIELLLIFLPLRRLLPAKVRFDKLVEAHLDPSVIEEVELDQCLQVLRVRRRRLLSGVAHRCRQEQVVRNVGPFPCRKQSLLEHLAEHCRIDLMSGSLKVIISKLRY